VVSWLQFSSSKKGTQAAFGGFSTRNVSKTFDSTANRHHIYLRQIELGLSSKSILWVDDNILNEAWENKRHMEAASSNQINHNIHFIPKTNTETALSYLRSPFGQRLKGKAEFRIISDMNRTNEVPVHNAGARFLKQLRLAGFNNKVLIFTSDAEKGQKLVNEECKTAAGDVKITTSLTDLNNFILFK
jgi:hypothetical protein